MILTLAWISRAVTCCAHRTGPEQAADFPSGFDGGNKEPQNTHRAASRHSLAHLTVIYVHATVVGCDRACACVTVLLCMRVCSAGPKFLQVSECGHTTSANSTPPRPSCILVRPQRADMKLDTTAGGWQRLLEQLPKPHTPLLSLLFSSSHLALSLIMTSQRESTQQHKHGYIGLYPVLHLRLCTFLHHVLMDNLNCPKKKHAWGQVRSGKKQGCYVHSWKVRIYVANVHEGIVTDYTRSLKTKASNHQPIR